jgi:excisionase family DNA binding protein
MATTYSVKEVAGVLGVGVATIYRLAHEGKLPHTRVGDKFRFTGAALRKYLHLEPTEPIVVPLETTDGATSDDTDKP